MPAPQRTENLSHYSPHCQKCGKSIQIASGLNAVGMTREREFKILRAIKWQLVPRIICRQCIELNESST